MLPPAASSWAARRGSPPGGGGGAAASTPSSSSVRLRLPSPSVSSFAKSSDTSPEPEAPFAPRVGAKDEDDGYLVSFVTDMIEDRSECVIVDAKDIAAGPVARILLPHRISSGTHACWAGREMLGG